MKSKWLIITIIISLFAGMALLTTRHFHTHDDLQVFRLNEYLNCWVDKQIPCRWSSEMGKGYGYPYFIFYPPMIYLIPAIIHLVTGQSLIFSLNLSAYLTFPLAAFAMYRLIHTVTKKEWAASLSAILYTFAPYHALNIFVRGVYAENLAWALLPLLMSWVYDLCRKNQSYLKLTLGISLLILTHNISAMLMLPLLLAWGLVSSNLQPKSILRLLSTFLFAIGISAWFFLPAIVEKSLVQTESMVFDYYSYLNHFVSLKQIFLSNYWGFGGSGYETQFDGMSFAIGYPITAALLIGLIVLYRAEKISLNRRLLILIPVALGLLALFMTHAKSTFLWQILPMLAYIQFPWRFLGIATTMLIVGASLSLSSLSDKQGKIISLLLISAALMLYADKFRPEKYDLYTDRDFIQGQFIQDQQSAHLYDYLPKTAHSVPDEFRNEPIFRSITPINSTQVNRTSSSLVLNIENPLDQEIILAQYDYPGWTVTVDGKSVNHTPDPLYGFISLPLPSGSHQVSATLRESPLRRHSVYLSIVSLISFLLYNVYYAKKS